MAASEQKKEGMTVQQAGHLGGQRVKELIEQGKRAEQASQKSMSGDGRGQSREEQTSGRQQSNTSR